MLIYCVIVGEHDREVCGVITYVLHAGVEAIV
jgi:hypothetical protein